MAETERERAIACAVQALSKAFGGVAALDQVDFQVERGEVHALLGENGAGKTTLCNVLAGVYRADGGSVFVDGEEVHLKNPGQAIDAGVGMVHQHFRLVEQMTVAENLHLGWRETPRLVTRRHLDRRSRALMQRVGLSADPNSEVWQLSVGEQQRVEILRVLARGARVLILDEPTAVLTEHEARELFGVMRALADEGHSVIFISHKLREVLAVSDRVTVLRGGRHVVTMRTADTNARELARLMTGAESELAIEHRVVSGPPVLSLAGVSALNDRGLSALRAVDIEVRAGEIVGVAGVSGNGQTELAQVVSGLRPVTGGTVLIDGKDIAGMTVRDIIDCGVGHIPEDRLEDGMLSSATVVDNAILRSYWRAPLSDGLSLSRARARQFAEDLVRDGRVKTRSVDAPAGQMSGGNQQRLVARREAAVAQRVLVAAQPTRGLDVLATHEVQTLIRDRRDAGCAVLLISDDLDEVLQMSDRIVVMYEGEVMGVMPAVAADREVLGLMMGGQRQEAV